MGRKLMNSCKLINKTLFYVILTILISSIAYSANIDIGMKLYAEKYIEISSLKFVYNKISNLNNESEFCITEINDKLLYKGCFEYPFDTMFNLKQVLENKSNGRKYGKEFHIIIPYNENTKKIIIYQNNEPIYEYEMKKYNKYKLNETIHPEKIKYSQSKNIKEKDNYKKNSSNALLITAILIIIFLTYKLFKKR